MFFFSFLKRFFFKKCQLWRKDSWWRKGQRRSSETSCRTASAQRNPPCRTASAQRSWEGTPPAGPAPVHTRWLCLSKFPVDTWTCSCSRWNPNTSLEPLLANEALHLLLFQLPNASVGATPERLKQQRLLKLEFWGRSCCSNVKLFTVSTQILVSKHFSTKEVSQPEAAWWWMYVMFI